MRIEVYQEPKPLKRHRFYRGKVYDPSKKDKEKFAWIVKKLMGDREPFTENLRVKLLYHMKIPSSYSEGRKRDLKGRVHDKRPDLSNLIKFTEDALNGVLWADDALISSIFAMKIYGEVPKTVIEVIENPIKEKSNEVNG
jgi:Holliday junction resolvase RusA-like endonuclease